MAFGTMGARFLATLVLDPKQLSVEDIDRLVWSEKSPHIADWFSAYVVKVHPENETLREMWMKSDDPMAARFGWSITADRVAKKAANIALPALLDRIEAEMPTAAPETQKNSLCFHNRSFPPYPRCFQPWA